MSKSLDNSNLDVLRASVPILSFDGTNVQDKAVIYFADRDTVGDGAGGQLRFLKGSTATANGVTIYVVPGGRLVRELTGPIKKKYRDWET